MSVIPASLSRFLRSGVHLFIVKGVLEGRWLTRDRALAYCLISGVFNWGLLPYILLVSHGGYDFHGVPICLDFVSFWTASIQVQCGHVAEVYNEIAHHLAEKVAFHGMTFGNVAFYYPPTWLLFCLPFALASYPVAVGLFEFGSVAVFVAVVRRLLPQRWAWIPILMFPGLVINIVNGQNGLLTGSFLGLAMVLIPTWPFLAGMSLGVLVIKPQLLLAAPVVLLCARQWRVIAGGLCSGLGLIAVSWLTFGPAAWSGFFRVSAIARKTYEMSYVPAWKMQSVFTSVRLLHGSIAMAYVAQITMTLLVLALAGWAVWRRPASSYAEAGRADMAVMIAALPFCSPFLLDYDLACLAFPMAWVLERGLRNGWWSGEKFVLFLIFLYLPAARVFGHAFLLCPTPSIAFLLLLIVVRRAASERWRQARAFLHRNGGRHSTASIAGEGVQA
ncbi:hypothetical protein AA0472_2631 [Acetobacter estunensis NRIC 0472]|uniref:DUF2029 domain-containing protein n=1 Tax=Acetobacter estunensis TaxID=104097 RepID=A0A967EC18_9PROT|nr:glycosyltransferase family 87 protein [Acetobacter estunensis]NHO52791.1 DUF2029 domain-containing protein [Acetobacter estunensis]GBQ28249.1 hypothetical protein AA0472_2631 [Acetobacter estunensis NRIC 0472]